ncbi:MAG: hypothetical protein GFH27_549415n4 [Chloroflexi bacterium AL-W]|nr:hypothetical protein [Chloroflexi bacterium AL-N1]NOK71452.1 hypothetical protein [Chloroflexi bacterium AL-N10]NOK77233.1 hypothetical protein [Chloroflexi bacterium AL-N5]NOK86273.1 hypothetical protein [Chloroflexi bacterium AL-W]NOK93243.1 hypothetical protein [Chloroflexi bacterium AL-N15]
MNDSIDEHTVVGWVKNTVAVQIGRHSLCRYSIWMDIYSDGYSKSIYVS